LETIERDYAPRGVRFFYIYKALAHPETNGYITPFTLSERLMHIAEAKRTLDTKFTWICDSMSNDLKHALGDRPNSEFVIDPNGTIVVARQWSRPEQLRRDLASLVGEVENPTQVSDLNMKRIPNRPKAEIGVVPRVKTPSPMDPLLTKPVETAGTPHYAKLRVELGNNQLYLGIFLDPLYKVHWNNQAAAVQYEIEPPAGVTVEPATGAGPKVDVDADADPREFLVAIEGRSEQPMKITIKYFACDDAETFCIPVTQQYWVSFDRDRDGGSRRSSNRSAPAADGRGSPLANRMFEMMRRLPIMAALDRDRDGTISASEIDQAPNSLRGVDRNRDNEITLDEMRPRPVVGPRG
jgi:hypothetical protein